MKLKIFNLLQETHRRRSKNSIHINKAGCFTFSQAVCESLGLKPGIKVEFAQDESRPRDFYFLVSQSPDAYPLRAKKGAHSVIFNSVTLFAVMNESLKLGGKAVTLPVSVAPVEHPSLPPLYAILTAAVKP